MNRESELYEVISGNTTSVFDGQYTALALRSESIVRSEASGFVNFFVGDTTPVYVGQEAYMIDKSGELSARLKAVTQTQAILNENDLSLIRNSLDDFKAIYNEADFFEAYHFKYQLESQILDLINSSIFDNNGNFASNAYNIFYSDLAGIAVHYTDGFEEYSTDNLESFMFKRTDYNKKIVKANDYIEVGSPVYKVITSENWYLIIQVNDPQVFENMDTATVEFLKDGTLATGNFKLSASGGKYYGIISLNKYMVRYASDRYLQISFVDTTLSGLKIPKSSVVEKDYYVIPGEYLTQGANSSDLGFAVKTKTSDGKDSVVLKYPVIVKNANDLCYISMDEGVLSEGDVLVMPDSVSEFTVGMKSPISGVYQSNGGSINFRYIDILGENAGFYIVSDNTVGGLRLYDQIFYDYHDAEKK